MRRRVPKLKVQQQVSVPKRLVELMRYAHRLIVDEDDSAATPSDDLIQITDDWVNDPGRPGGFSGYGGLIEEGSSQFAFVYFADGMQKRRKWELELSRDQIANIASGNMGELTLWACVSPNCGCKFHSADGLCFDCDYEKDTTAA
jgi:hypothetical protein